MTRKMPAKGREPVTVVAFGSTLPSELQGLDLEAPPLVNAPPGATSLPFDVQVTQDQTAQTPPNLPRRQIYIATCAFVGSWTASAGGEGTPTIVCAQLFRRDQRGYP